MRYLLSPVSFKMDSGVSIVVAEDNEDDIFILQRAFKECGLMRPPQFLPDGVETIKYLHGEAPYSDRMLHPFPDILILDLKMPRASGFEVLEWINQHPDYRVIPAIVWSASADRRDVKHAFCLGAHAYLCKPAGLEHFTHVTRSLLEFWSHCEKPGLEPFKPNCDEIKETNPLAGARVP